MTLYIYGYCLLQPLHEYGSISWHSELLQALVYIVRSTLSFIIFNITHKVVQCDLKSLLNYRQSIAYINTPWTVKRCHFVFDYNSGISWSIFLYFLHQWKQVGILYKHVDKIYHFTLPGKTKTMYKQHIFSQSSQCVHSNRLFAIFAESLKMFVFSIFGRELLYQSSSRKTCTFSVFLSKN